MISSKTMEEVFNLPQLSREPLQWVMEGNPPKQGSNLLWLEFGVWRGGTIRYISHFTPETIYGFDSFEGLPEFWRDGFNEGTFNESGRLPSVPENVQLVKGWFNDTLPTFLQQHKDKQISFVHLDADLYSSTAFILSSIAPYLCADAVLVFDELINYPEFDGENGELRAWDEFVQKYNVQYTWIGGHGGWGCYETHCEKAAVIIHDLTV